MKKLLLIALLYATTAGAQTRADYDMTIGRFLHYYDSLKTDSMYLMMSDRIHSTVAQDKMEATFKQIYLKMGDVRSHSYVSDSNGFYYYKTVFAKAVVTIVIGLDTSMKMTAFQFLPYNETAVVKEPSNFVLKVSDGDINGTLVLPERSGKVPVALIIAGSGPTDRDGNDPMGLSTNAYKMLADSLQKSGIASVRYDKRGAGEGTTLVKDESKLTFTDIVDDAEGFVRKLKADPRFSKVIVIGHSEGSLIGMIATAREHADAFVSLSGVDDRIDKVVEKQIADGAPQYEASAKRILDSLAMGYTVKNVDDDLQELFHASLQPYMISWLKYNPAQEIKKVHVPVLIIQGTTDMQVDVAQAKMLKKDCPHAELRIIEGMNHVLKQSPADKAKNAATYSDPSLPLSPGLAGSIITFINTIK